MKWLNYHHLYYFQMIANEGGIARAAQKLRLGQPTLSTQLKQLEDSLEHPLFERVNRSLVLTEAGKVALEYANSIFGMGNELLQVLEDKSFTGRSDVKLGLLDSVPKHIALSLTLAAQKAGNCTVALLEGRGDELFRELTAHQIDLVISDYAPVSSETGRTYSRSIAKVPVAVYGSPKFAALRKGFPASLAGQPFVMPTVHSRLRHDLEHFFNTRKIRVVTTVETQDTAVHKLLGIGGVGLIGLPEFAAHQLVADKKLTRIGILPSVQQEFWIVSAARRIENPIAAKLMKEFELKSGRL